jgi:hypothetical protein
VPLLQAFKAPRKLEKVERQFRAISIQIILFATGGAVGHLFWSWPGKPYHGPSATKADVGNQRKPHLEKNVRNPAVLKNYD